MAACIGALIATFVGILMPRLAWARVLVVGRDAATITATIAMAQEGDVVEVPTGTYREHVVVDRTITLRGTGGIIDGDGQGTALRVMAPAAIIDNLEVQNSGGDLGGPDCCIYVDDAADGTVIRNNVVRDCAFGIWIHHADRTKVLNNRVTGRPHRRNADRGNGIHLFDSSYLEVVGNDVRDARDGIYVSATDDSLIADNRTNHQRYGIHYMYSQRNTLRGNTASDNNGGMALMQSRNLVVEDNVAEHNVEHGLLFRDAQYCEIRRNRIVENGQGMFFFSSTDNRIEENYLAHNDVGAKIWAGSLRNVVTRNAFVGNRQQVFFVSASDLVWGDEGAGNYWSDYMGWDQDGDGLGDRPYRVDSFTANLVYRYPAAVVLMRSPALELLTHLERNMPLLRVPTVVDRAPLMFYPRQP